MREVLPSLYHLPYDSPITVFSSIFLEPFFLSSGVLSPHSLRFALESFKLSSLCPILHVSTSFTPFEHLRVLPPTSTVIAPPSVERSPPGSLLLKIQWLGSQSCYFLLEKKLK
ncbi:hypothetical protein P8452_41275 [Trifolium repens]|nr:hypothetical protein P8452_41275 [Trifolium repens]